MKALRRRAKAKAETSNIRCSRAQLEAPADVSVICPYQDQCFSETARNGKASDTNGNGGQTSHQSGSFVQEQVRNAPSEDETQSCGKKILGMD